MLLQLWIFFSSFDALHICTSFVYMGVTNSRMMFLQRSLGSQAEFFPFSFELLKGEEKWLFGFIVDLEAQCLF